MAKGDLLHTYTSEKAVVRIFAGDRDEESRMDAIKAATIRFVSCVERRKAIENEEHKP